jgi:hypothetical protein
MGAITVQEQPKVNLTTAAVEEALDRKVTVPDDCICDYATELQHRIVQRVINPACTAEHTIEMERERDE